MDTEWLLDFLAVCQMGNFTKAAEARNVSQPAFSRRIQTLEAWAGVPLLDRGTHKIVTTAAGDVFKVQAQQIISQVNQAHALTLAAANRGKSTVRIACTDALSFSFLPDWINKVTHELNPHITVSLNVANFAECMRMLNDGIVNFVVFHHHPDLDHRYNLGVAQQIDIASDVLVLTSHPLLLMTEGRAERLPFIAFGSDSAFDALTRSHNENLDFECYDILETTTVQTVISNVRLKSGIGWCLRSLIEKDLGDGTLVQAAKVEIPLSIRIARLRARQSSVAEAMWAFAGSDSRKHAAEMR